jgi:hypothetical protein
MPQGVKSFEHLLMDEGKSLLLTSSSHSKLFPEVIHPNPEITDNVHTNRWPEASILSRMLGTAREGTRGIP